MSPLLGPMSPDIPQCIGMDFAMMHGRLAQFHARVTAYTAWSGSVQVNPAVLNLPTPALFEPVDLALLCVNADDLGQACVWMIAFLAAADHKGAEVKHRDRIDQFLDTCKQVLSK